MYESPQGTCNNSSMTCSAIVLCGGRGSRVGGNDKGLLPWGKSSLVESVLARIAGQVDDIVISANRNREQYEQLGYPVVGDLLADYQGPLAGLQAALGTCRHETVFVTACDTPLLPDDVVTRLLEALGHSDLSYAWDGERDHYLVAALHRRLGSSLSSYLSAGKRSVRGWYQMLHCERVDFSDEPQAFLNVNRPLDA